MHVTMQTGGRSPKPVSGSTSASQLKSGSDNVPNAVTSFSSQAKGRKRERGDQGFEPIKRERSSKVDDVDSIHCRPESNLKSEIAKITDRGGLVDLEGVEKLMQLMLPNKVDKKLDLTGRSLLLSVIAASDDYDCLHQFVQLRGLPVLDEWLQEVHKGKIGDGSSSKDNDKSVEEFLLVLLRALDKLPVNLNALQTCNIGKSVNYLRTHKNLEVQRKARSLVDTWKKRVDAEMNNHDIKSGSSQPVPWLGRPRHAEHDGNRQLGGSSEAAMKSSVTQVSASRSASVKPVQADTVKSASASLGTTKMVASSATGGNKRKEGPPRNAAVGGAVDVIQTVARDEKSSSSSHSHNISQSCSSEHAKTVGFQGKEDARSSTAGSISVNKSASGASRHRKSANGHPGPTLSGVQRESGSSRSSLQRITAAEKVSQSELPCDKSGDAPGAEASNHKLIVKIPNRGRGPAQSAGGNTCEDPSIMNSRASSPVTSEKHEQFDGNMKEKSDSSRSNNNSDVKSESWQSNDFKDVLIGSDDGDGSPGAGPVDERCRTTDDDKSVAELPRSASSFSGSEIKSRKLHEASFSSMNSLGEGCLKYTMANASNLGGDDVGISLLATVAAGEVTKSDLVLPNDCLVKKTNLEAESCTPKDVKSRPTGSNDTARGEIQPSFGGNDDIKKQSNIFSKHALTDFSGERKSLSVEKPGDHNDHKSLSSMDLGTVDCKPGLAVTCALDKATNCELKQCQETKADLISGNAEKTSDSKLIISFSEMISSVEDGKQHNEGLLSYASLINDGENQKSLNEGLNSCIRSEEKRTSTMADSEVPEKRNEEVPLPYNSDKDLSSQKSDEFKVDNADEMVLKSHVSRADDEHNNSSPTCKNPVEGGFLPVANNKGERVKEALENNEVLEHQCGGTASQTEIHRKSREARLTAMDVDETEECASTTADTSFSAAGCSDMDRKLDFDLNEGFSMDEEKFAEPVSLVPPVCTAPMSLISPLPVSVSVSVSSVSSGLPASITVAAAAKGPFLPPQDLLRSKGEVGWKGSAATSAFRPAEPRKVLEMSLGTNSISAVSDASTGKPGRLPLDIDLNVPDETVYEDMACPNLVKETGLIASSSNNHDMTRSSASGRSSGGLDFDLNQADEAIDLGPCSTSNVHRLQIPLLPTKSLASGRNPNGEVRFQGNFDLNSGPCLDEGNVESSAFSRHARSSLTSQAPVACIRMNHAEAGNFSSWYPPGNTYSTVTVPSILPDRGEQSFPIIATGGPPRILGSHAGGNSFGPDGYRGPVLSSSPAGSFPSTPFQYPVFPFGTSFPLPSATYSVNSTAYMDASSGGRLCFPAVPTQLLGPAGSVSSQFPRPFIISLQDAGNSGVQRALGNAEGRD